MTELTDLDRRIIGALMVRPRASWRLVAEVLGEPERTVTRRGTNLLQDRIVTVAGIRTGRLPVLVTARAAPGTTRVVAQALARRSDTSFVYEVTGAAEVVAELITDGRSTVQTLTEELPGITGVQRLVSSPILHYFKTLREWQPGVLTAEERAALLPPAPPGPGPFGYHPELSSRDLDIVAALAEDGRATAEAVGRRAGVSEPTARRRIDWLLDNAVVHLRALVDPSHLGLPVQALVWIKASPGRVEEIGRLVADQPRSRYVAALAGEHQILADLTVPTLRDFYDLTTIAPWADSASEVTASVVLRVSKRDGRVVD